MVAKKQEVATTDSALPAGWHDVDFNAAFNICAQEYGQVVSSTDVIGDGFILLPDKAMAVGREFLVIDWKFITDKDTGREYASMRIINPQNEKAIINDGSTGIYRQLKDLSDRGIRGGIHCSNGLRVSEYVYENDNGEKSNAKTYYLA